MNLKYAGDVSVVTRLQLSILLNLKHKSNIKLNTRCSFICILFSNLI